VKILFVGNSQLGCLKLAFDETPDVLHGHEIHFQVFPGGEGPSFDLEGGKLVPIQEAVNPNFPPRVSPEEAAELPVDAYDVIVVSALGYVDGGFYYKNPATLQGQLHGYGPKTNDLSNRPLSAACYRSLISGCLRGQDGFKFLSRLRASFRSRIIVQPFPLMSEIVRDHPGWSLNRMYEDPIGAHRFITQARDEVLAAACDSVSAVLLPHPDASWKDQLFTPRELMGKGDGLHPLPPYGEMVLRQVVQAL
jgi:hypothetical protein